MNDEELLVTELANMSDEDKEYWLALPPEEREVVRRFAAGERVRLGNSTFEIMNKDEDGKD